MNYRWALFVLACISFSFSLPAMELSESDSSEKEPFKVTLKDVDEYSKILHARSLQPATPYEVVVNPYIEQSLTNFLDVMINQFDPEIDYKHHGIGLVKRVREGDLRPVSDNVTLSLKPGGTFVPSTLSIDSKLDHLFGEELLEYVSTDRPKITDKYEKKESDLQKKKLLVKKSLNCFSIEQVEDRIVENSIWVLCSSLYDVACTTIDKKIYKRGIFKLRTSRVPQKYNCRAFSMHLNYKMPIAGVPQGRLYYLEAMLRYVKKYQVKE